jgi:predicted nucleic acid-binding protein
MTAMFVDLYPDVAVPKTAWQWVESAQYRLLRAGAAHRALSCVDLLICASAAIRGLVVLHDDNDFITAAQHLPDLAERRIQASPEPA